MRTSRIVLVLAVLTLTAALVSPAAAMAANVTGTVRSHLTGLPIAGARMLLYDPYTGRYPGEALTDASGRYTLKNAKVIYTVIACDVSFLQQVAQITSLRTPVDFTLVAACSISGRLVDLDWEYPHPDIYLWQARPTGPVMIASTYVLSGGDPAYTFNWLPAGTYYVEFYSGGAASVFWNGATSLAAATPITLTEGQSAASVDCTMP